MADFKRLAPDYAVAAQLSPADVAEAARAGFKLIVANRPDGEAPGQPSLDDIDAAARAAGLWFVRIPIAGPPPPGAVDATVAAIAGAGGPVLAYCRSGTRSATLWAMATAKAGKLGVADILSATAAAGYDLSPQAGALERLARG
jgi:uncharacterized protein (TIGR01244 family)